jgi:hypothetical protein
LQKGCQVKPGEQHNGSNHQERHQHQTNTTPPPSRPVLDGDFLLSFSAGCVTWDTVGVGNIFPFFTTHMTLNIVSHVFGTAIGTIHTSSPPTLAALPLKIAYNIGNTPKNINNQKQAVTQG